MRQLTSSLVVAAALAVAVPVSAQMPPALRPERPYRGLFGGDTAFAVVEALGIRGLNPVGEICQGVVVSRAKGSRDRGVRNLVTKAGGFGPVDVVDRIVGALEQEA